MFTELLEKVVRHEDLTADEAAAAMREVMEGRAAPAALAALLSALVMKGERPSEIVGFARATSLPLFRIFQVYSEFGSAQESFGPIGPKGRFRRGPTTLAADRGDVAVGSELATWAAPLFVGLSLLDECRSWCEQAFSGHYVLEDLVDVRLG